jgi:hypothetical protein
MTPHERFGDQAFVAALRASATAKDDERQRSTSTKRQATSGTPHYDSIDVTAGMGHLRS